MRQLLLTLAITITCFSCGSAGEKEKDPVIKDTVTTIPDTARQKTITPVTVTTDSTKTVTLTFTGYDEGDYPHLLFTEVGTGTEYDFGHPEDNVLNNIDVVLKSNNTAFGYKVNNNMKGKKFVAEIIYKMVDTHDEDGQPIRGKEWRIASFKKSE